MRAVWLKEPNTFDGKMLWAAAALCCFGFLRSGEISIPSDSAFDEGTHLGFSDVTVDSLRHPQVIRVCLKASKTDPFRVGINIFVGRADNRLCPVTAILSYVVERGAGSGPFFRFQDGRPLTRTSCHESQGSPHGVWNWLHGLFWPQLQEWSGYNSCKARNLGCYY